MKFLICITLLLIHSATHSTAQTPVYGEANLFSYDAMGNRVVRNYDANTIINLKPGNTRQDTVLQKINENISLLAYPNPVGDLLTVENLSWGKGDLARIEVFDITGKIINSGEVTTAKYDIQFNGFAPGFYIVNYYLNRQLLTTWKVVKQ